MESDWQSVPSWATRRSSGDLAAGDEPSGDGSRGGSSAPRFFCDDHLRRLCRWLRCAGYDVAWEPEIDDLLLAGRCLHEGRILLTMHKALERIQDVEVCVIPSHDPMEQLCFVREQYDLDLLGRAFSRCSVCNLPLGGGTGEGAPDRIRRLFDRFYQCTRCGRTYWMGDHVRHMLDRFEKASGG